jgi:GAF domain-containing protein
VVPSARAPGPDEPLGGASRAIERARELLPQLQAALDAAGLDVERSRETTGRAEELSRRLHESETEREALFTRLRESEAQMGRLMTLYVATYQLHCTLNPEEVQSTIIDIVLNLLGAESFALLLRANNASHYETTIAYTTDGVLPAPFDTGHYAAGDPLVDATLQEGSLMFGPMDGSPALAAVPLRVQDVVVGALVVFKLLGHKPAFQNEDSELFDLIGAHAASALVASRVYAGMARKLRTLEELLTLVKGG